MVEKEHLVALLSAMVPSLRYLENPSRIRSCCALKRLHMQRSRRNPICRLVVRKRSVLTVSLALRQQRSFIFSFQVPFCYKVLPSGIAVRNDDPRRNICGRVIHVLSGRFVRQIDFQQYRRSVHGRSSQHGPRQQPLRHKELIASANRGL